MSGDLHFRTIIGFLPVTFVADWMQMQISFDHPAPQAPGLDDTDLLPATIFGPSTNLANNPNIASFMACQDHDDIQELMGHMAAETTAAGQVTAAILADNPADYMVLMAGGVSCVERHTREHEREIGVLQHISHETGERLTDAEDRILSEEGNVRGLRQAIMAMQKKIDALEAKADLQTSQLRSQASELQALHQKSQVSSVVIEALVRLANVDHDQVSTLHRVDSGRMTLTHHRLAVHERHPLASNEYLKIAECIWPLITARLESLVV